ncbi:MAG TPA: hypothetical protein VED40_15560 [Azospirillaceae bacterium]|nr:hypothetical protein [Azospirillaceae bacterium]
MTDALPSRPRAVHGLPERASETAAPSRLETLKLWLDLGPRLVATLVVVFLLADNYADVKQVIHTLAQPENSEKVLNYLIGDKPAETEETAENGPHGRGDQPEHPADQAAAALDAYGDLMRAAANMGTGDGEIVKLAGAYKDFADKAGAASSAQAEQLREELKALHRRRHKLAQDYAGG